MNYYKYYKNLRLDELDIASDEEAEELEFELELRFEEFTPRDRKTWLQQNTYLEHFSRIGSVTSAAREAGVTVYKAQTWKFDNVLGFTRRLEVADLAFNDRLKEKALRRASDPKAPATLLIELLRAYIPEQFSRNGHKCDTSKSDELLRHFREDARREMEAGHPTLRKIAEGATNAHPHDDLPTQSVRPNDNQPLDAAEVRSDNRPVPSRHSRVRGNPQTVPTRQIGPNQTPNVPTSPDSHEDIHNDDYPSFDAGPNPSRAQRREQLRQQRKAEKKNTFPVVRF